MGWGRVRETLGRSPVGFSETLPLASANSAAPFVIGTLLAERYRLDRCCSADPDQSDAVLWRAADQMAGEAPVALRQLKGDAASLFLSS